MGILAYAAPNRADEVTADVEFSASEIYVGVAGDVSVVPASGGGTVVFKNAPAGLTLPVLVSMVNSVGTTATDLVRCWRV